MYWLLTGAECYTHPEDAPNAAFTTVSRRRKIRDLDAGKIPKRWDRTIAACLAPDPDRRPKSVADIPLMLRGKRQAPKLMKPKLGSSLRSRVALVLMALLLIVVGYWGLFVLPDQLTLSLDEVFEEVVKGRTSIDRYNYEDALKRAERALRSWPDNSRAKALKSEASGLLAIRNYEGGDGDYRQFSEYYAAVAELADSGHPAARFWQGQMKIAGHGVSHDLEEGLDDIKEAANLGNLQASVAIGLRMIAGYGLEKDGENGLDLIAKGEAANEPSALFAKAWLHRIGQGVDLDRERAAQLEARAFQIYQRQARDGSWQAMKNELRSYWNGWGVSQDREKALSLADDLIQMGSISARLFEPIAARLAGDFEGALAAYHECERLGNSRAISAIGWLHESGKLSSGKDLKVAREYYRRAMEGNCNISYTYLGLFHIPNNDSVSKVKNELVGGANLEIALGYFKEAANRGSTLALTQIGDALVRGHHPVLEENDSTRDWFLMSAVMGNAAATRIIGHRYNPHSSPNPYRLTDIPGEDQRAVDWFLAAAHRGDENAMGNLGFAYRDGWHPDDEDLHEAFGWFQKGSESGDTESKVALGDFYRPVLKEPLKSKYARVTDPDADKAINFYTEAADWDHPGATRQIGIASRDGWHPDGKDMQKAFDWFRKAAELNDAGAMGSLGHFYQPGLGEPWKTDYGQVVAPSAAKAVEWFDRAADKGGAYAMMKLGFAFRDGWHPDGKDLQKAFDWFTKAAELEDANAMAALGAFYQPDWDEPWKTDYGQVVAPNAAKAVEWFDRAADKGDAYAMKMLGFAYRDGWHLDGKDLQKAYEWFLKAADLGDAYAMMKLGFAFRDGWHPDGKDLQKAFDWFTKAAELEVANAMAALGVFYQPDLDEPWKTDYGQVVAPNASKAVEWFDRAADKGDAYAMMKLGFAFRDGWHPDGKDLQNAFAWFMKAAELEDADAMAALGLFYQPDLDEPWKTDYAQVVAADGTIAVKWFEKAANKGNALAMQKLGFAYRDGWHPEDANAKKAFEWFLKGSEAGDAYSTSQVANFYRDNWNEEWKDLFAGAVKPDLSKAVEYYLKAAELGDGFAMDAIGWAYRQGWHPEGQNKPKPAGGFNVQLMLDMKARANLFRGCEQY